jgi:thymidylate synthase (FAD)
MTKQVEILNDPKYIPVLDYGFVGLVDHMGSDSDIVSAARVSYGDGTKTINEDRGLIRYLVSHKHTSPIEMAEVKLHIRMPIFIMRQWVRHRTASLNEYSGRYSVMTDEFYVPEIADIQPQSKDNKQGRGGTLLLEDAEHAQDVMEIGGALAYHEYQSLLGSKDHDADHWSPEFPGIARETARINLPLSSYTELYWKQDLHNLLHLIKLRRDVHAQKEIRDYAEAVFTLIQPLFPLTIEAWEDYIWNARTLSRMQIEMFEDLLSSFSADVRVANWIEEQGGPAEFAKNYGMTLRELKETRKTWGL